MVIANMKSEIRASRTLVYPQTIEKDELLQKICGEFNRFIADSAIPRDDIDGVGVGLPGGIVTIVTTLAAAPGWCALMGDCTFWFLLIWVRDG